MYKSSTLFNPCWISGIFFLHTYSRRQNKVPVPFVFRFRSVSSAFRFRSRFVCIVTRVKQLLTVYSNYTKQRVSATCSARSSNGYAGVVLQYAKKPNGSLLNPGVFLCSPEAFFARFLTAGNSWCSLLTVSYSENTIERKRVSAVCAIVFTVPFPLGSVCVPYWNRELYFGVYCSSLTDCRMQ